MFLDRAAAADPHLVFGVDDLDAAARICRRLDGMPLAIELAADMKHDSRHSSVEAAIAWSYDLLDETEKAVFLALGVSGENRNRLAT